MNNSGVKPLVRWAMAKGYLLRFSQRGPGEARGIVTTQDAERTFRYDPDRRVLVLDAPPHIETIRLNEYGWQEQETGNLV